MKLFQEQFTSEPFWMMVGCCLLNRASWARASSPHATLRLAYPTPRELAAADPRGVEAVVRPVGFGRQRASRLIGMASDWLAAPPRTAADVLLLRGCGKYAADSFAIFVEGRVDVEPSDHYLAEYLRARSPTCPV